MSRFDFPTRIITEGKTRLLVPDTSKYKHPAHAPVFFNPAMHLNRDITVSFFSAVKVRSFLDAMAGVGAKGIRVLNESGQTDPKLALTLNDKNPLAIKFIKENLTLNGLDARVTQMDANVLMREEKFQAIDVDPFGSVAPFMDSACAGIRDKGYLAITATDTAALTGSYPRAGLRKYGVRVGRTSFMHELGIRALAAFAIREGAKYGLALVPVFCHSTLHYYRIYFLARRNRNKATKQVQALKWLVYNRKTDDRTYSNLQDPSKENYGPVWSGPLFDASLVKMMKGVSEKSEKLINLAKDEADFSLPYIDSHILSSKYRVQLPKLEDILAILEDQGIRAARTHFCGHCFKAEAQPSEIIKFLKG